MLLVKVQVVQLIPDHRGEVFLIPLAQDRGRCSLNEQISGEPWRDLPPQMQSLDPTGSGM